MYCLPDSAHFMGVILKLTVDASSTREDRLSSLHLFQSIKVTARLKRRLHGCSKAMGYNSVLTL